MPRDWQRFMRREEEGSRNRVKSAHSNTCHSPQSVYGGKADNLINLDHRITFQIAGDLFSDFKNTEWGWVFYVHNT